MKIGLVKEVKDKENRVALTPAGAAELTARRHEVRVETGAGVGSGFADEEYEGAGARITDTTDAWNCDLVIKVKEPIEPEYPHLCDQIVFTYFHLAGVSPGLTHSLLENGTTAVAYETVRDADGRLPLLAPMSAVAGTMAPLVGTRYLAKQEGGSGVLLGDIMDRRYGKVVIIGDGVVGIHSATVAAAMRTEVVVVGRHEERAVSLQRRISPSLRYVLSNPENIAREVTDADVVIGAVLVAGERAPHLVTREMLERVRPGSVAVDVCIDQGGCFESSRATTHSQPTYVDCGVTHYCVTNMPGAYPRTSTFALTDATLPYVLELADLGRDALEKDPGLAEGVNTYHGFVTNRAVADATGTESRYREFSKIDGTD